MSFEKVNFSTVIKYLIACFKQGGSQKIEIDGYPDIHRLNIGHVNFEHQSSKPMHSGIGPQLIHEKN